MIKHNFSLWTACWCTLKTLHLHNQKRCFAKKNKMFFLIIYFPSFLPQMTSIYRCFSNSFCFRIGQAFKYIGPFPCVTVRGGSIPSLFGKKTYWIESKKENHLKSPIWLRNLNNCTYPFLTGDRMLIHSSKRKLQ